METVKVEAKLKFKLGGYGDKLLLKIKFKSPDKILKVYRKLILESTNWDYTYENYKEFNERCLLWFTTDNEGAVREVVQEEVIKYFKGKVEQIEIKEIQKQIKGVKKMEFQIEMKEN
ncbi:hypothetical protein CIL05_07790 [Virgibacillus profundi]|uniref:Uncharacterized protein n=1 Tax=Virgibacillus profundi TaxID=2024555 RepID=A0A2A2IGJ3_9BACI|nr:hypothetical protein [Virgibacillus profundi]PAV30364.1 hypothetical protein CIL05_07790 [Virgibacillus profundi]PXY54536.1 hypothetical protein CIT14_07875 [Virgibacillus profundi]